MEQFVHFIFVKQNISQQIPRQNRLYTDINSPSNNKLLTKTCF